MKRVVAAAILLVVLMASACTSQQRESPQGEQEGSPVVTVYQAPT